MPERKITFIITSVIHFSHKKLSKSIVRSVFTPDQRTEQTIKTVKSIREKIPNATIILLEMGKEKDIAEELVRAVDKYVYIGNNRWVRWSVNGRRRGLGEAIGLIASGNELENNTDFFFKMSGRYYLNDDFKKEAWNGNYFLARKYERGISTRFYGFSKEFFRDWQRALKRSLLSLYFGSSIEDVLPEKFGKERIHDVRKIGLAGYVAPDGSYLEE